MWHIPSFLAKSGGAVPGTVRPTPVIPLLVESVVSRLLGRNRWPAVPRVQDPNKSEQGLCQKGSDTFQ
jgi:hypothetical protein